MQTKTNEVNGVKYTVHGENGLHAIQARYFYARIYPVYGNTDKWEAWIEFGRALIQSTEVETPFLWPDTADSLDELQAAFDKWVALSPKVIRAWLRDLDTVDAAPTEPELEPSNPKKDESQQ